MMIFIKGARKSVVDVALKVIDEDDLAGFKAGSTERDAFSFPAAGDKRGL